MSKIFKTLFFATIIFLSSCQKDEIQVKATQITRFFFGDKEHNAVVAIDIEDMKLAAVIPTGHEITYTADAVGKTGKVYAVNRGSNAIDVIDCNTLELTKTIELQHFPRSAESINKTQGLVAVTGMNKPMVSIIDMKTDEVVATVGDDILTYPVQHNKTGSHACGHPYWLDAYHFILPDRSAMTLSTYFIGKSNGEWVTYLVNKIDTPSPVHQIINNKKYYQGDKTIFYATAEGITKEGDNNKYPSILELQFTPLVGLQIIREVELVSPNVDITETGLHHGDFHPTQKVLYTGSRDGTLFVVNYETMTVENTVKAGKGVGHTMMVPAKDLAVVINHRDIFVTLVDLKTNTKLVDVPVSESEELVGTTTIQAHPKYCVSDDKNFFYSFVTADGKCYELDLNTLSVSKTLDIGGKPTQGSFVKITREN